MLFRSRRTLDERGNGKARSACAPHQETCTHRTLVPTSLQGGNEVKAPREYPRAGSDRSVADRAQNRLLQVSPSMGCAPHPPDRIDPRATAQTKLGGLYEYAHLPNAQDPRPPCHLPPRARGPRPRAGSYRDRARVPPHECGPQAQRQTSPPQPRAAAAR